MIETGSDPIQELEQAKIRTRMSSHERREQLIGVARELLAERGFEATSIEEIAERAKVSKPIVYQHFGGKEGLYAVIIDREVRGLLGRITKTLEADHPRVALEQAVDSFLRYIEEDQTGFRILVRDAPVGSEGGSLPNVLAEIADEVEGLLARELRARDYPRKIAPILARALVGMIALTGQWWVDSGKPRRKLVAAHLVNLAWNGLRDLDPDPDKLKVPKRKQR